MRGSALGSLLDVGGLLGGIAGVLSLWLQRRDRRLYLSVAARHGTLLDVPPDLVSRAQIVDRMLPQGMAIVYFRVTNPREKAVEVVHVGVIRPNGQRRWWSNPAGDRSIPCKLESVDATRFWIPIEELVRDERQNDVSGVVTFKAEIQDSLGNSYTDDFEINIDNPVTY